MLTGTRGQTSPLPNAGAGETHTLLKKQHYLLAIFLTERFPTNTGSYKPRTGDPKVLGSP